MAPSDVEVEASLVKAMFTGLVVDLLATGERRRLGAALELGLARLADVLRGDARRNGEATDFEPPASRHRTS